MSALFLLFSYLLLLVCFIDATKKRIIVVYDDDCEISNPDEIYQKLAPTSSLGRQIVTLDTAKFNNYTAQFKNSRAQRKQKLKIYDETTTLSRLSTSNLKADKRDILVAALQIALEEVSASNAPTNRLLNVDDTQKEEPVFSPTYLESLNMDILEISGSVDIQEVLKLGTKLPCLLSPFELDSTRELLGAYPTDVSLEPGSIYKSWGLGSTNDGFVFGSQATAAWKEWRGISTDPIVVGVVDSGCSQHADLAPNLCGVDEDCAGYDFADDDFNPFDDPSPHHGTAVSGIISAVPNNNLGLAGICWGCKIMCLKVVASATGIIQLSSVLQALDYLREKKVKISNHSYGSVSYSVPEYNAISQLKRDGHLFITASGNNGCDLDEKNFDSANFCSHPKLGYEITTVPAAYDLDNIISVGSIDESGVISTFSNYGNVSVDIFAAGNAIPVLSLYELHSSLALQKGTSFASPLVAGIAALVWSRNPEMLYSDVRDIILSTATKTEAFQNKSTSGGYVNAFKAVSVVESGLTASLELEVFPPPTADVAADFYSLENQWKVITTTTSTTTTKFVIPVLDEEKLYRFNKTVEYFYRFLEPLSQLFGTA